jgi:hypothetical protein
MCCTFLKESQSALTSLRGYKAEYLNEPSPLGQKHYATMPTPTTLSAAIDLSLEFIVVSSSTGASGVLESNSLSIDWFDASPWIQE